MKTILNVNVKTIESGIKSILINDPKSYNSLSSVTLKSLLTAFKILNKDKFVKDFVAVCTKIMNADRLNLRKLD